MPNCTEIKRTSSIDAAIDCSKCPYLDHSLYNEKAIEPDVIIQNGMTHNKRGNLLGLVSAIQVMAIFLLFDITAIIKYATTVAIICPTILVISDLFIIHIAQTTSRLPLKRVNK